MSFGEDDDIRDRQSQGRAHRLHGAEGRLTPAATHVRERLRGYVRHGCEALARPRVPNPGAFDAVHIHGPACHGVRPGPRARQRPGPIRVARPARACALSRS